MYTFRLGADLLTVWDLLFSLFYLFLLFVYSYIVRLRKIERYPEYKYYIPGLFAKILGALLFLFLYTFYYPEGDTQYYFMSSESLLNLAFHDFLKFLSLMSGNLSNENFSAFTRDIGIPFYYYDKYSYSVVRFSVPFVFLAGKSYVASTILVAAFTFSGIWKLFRLLVKIFPDSIKTSAFSVLFVPSTLFWGSGILKDSYTLMATCYFFVAFYEIFVFRKNISKNIIIILFAFYIIVSIKPYIFFALIISSLLTIIHAQLKKIENKILKTILFPLLIVIVLLGGSFIVLQTGKAAGGFYTSIESMLKMAVEKQQDLIQDYYGKNSFDIGKFDPTIGGVLSKAHLAIIAGLFRPFYWEARNFRMLISATENFIFLFLSLYIALLTFFTIRKHGFAYVQKIILSDSFIVFSLLFSLIFALMIGITTANFGALVRYRIPLIPFYMSTLFIIIKNFNIEKETKRLI
jgi:hypothetical protein